MNASIWATRPKIPHSHHNEHNGQVLMFGDDHVEVVKAAKSAHVALYFSDKFREPVALGEYSVVVKLVDGGKTQTLAIKSSPATPNIGLIAVSPSHHKTGVLAIEVKRTHPPKGHLVSKTAQSVALSKVFK